MQKFVYIKVFVIKEAKYCFVYIFLIEQQLIQYVGWVFVDQF